MKKQKKIEKKIKEEMKEIAEVFKKNPFAPKSFKGFFLTPLGEVMVKEGKIVGNKEAKQWLEEILNKKGKGEGIERIVRIPPYSEDDPYYIVFYRYDRRLAK